MKYQHTYTISFRLIGIMVLRILTIAFVLAALHIPHSTSAQQVGLAIGPALFEAAVVPGQSRQQIITLRNTTATYQAIKASISPLKLAAETVFVKPDGAAIYDASRWITLDQSEFILQPGEERRLQVSILPPPNAEPGGHYATIVFTPVSSKASLPEHSAYLASAVGSIAFITVTGHIVNEATLHVPYRPPKLQNFGPIHLSYLFENTGNTHNLPSGSYEITDYFGHIVGSETIAPRIVLPGTKQPVPVSWGKSLLFNRYTFTPKITFGTPPQTLVAKPVVVWVIPWGLMILALAVLTGLFYTLKRTRHHWSKAWYAICGDRPPPEPRQ